MKDYELPGNGMSRQPETLMASRDLNLAERPDREYLQATVNFGKLSSVDSWRNYDRIGEVRYAVQRSARIAGYATLKGVRVSKTGEQIDVAETGVIADEVNAITSPFGGVRGLVQRYYTLMQVPGEAYLAAVRHNAADEFIDGYWFLSPSEVIDEGINLLDPKSLNQAIGWRTARQIGRNGESTAFTRKIETKDFYGRVWVPDAEYVDEPDSPMQAVNGMCDMLWDLTESIKARILQRFAIAGILAIPSQITSAAISGPKPADRMYADDQVLNYLIHIMSANRARKDRGVDAMPILLKGDADVLDKIKHIVIDPTIAETDLKLRIELIGRILDALNQQKQAAKGGEDTSHWGMWAVSDEERRITVQPDLDAMCHALTRMILHRRLVERKWTSNKIMPWRIGYELSEASVRSNIAEDARQAFDRFTVGPSFLRRASGGRDTDAPDSKELVRMFGNKHGDPYLAFYGLEGIAVEWAKVGALKGKTGPTAGEGGDPSEAGPGVGDPGSPNDRDSDEPKSETGG